MFHTARSRNLHPDILPYSAGRCIPAAVCLDIPVLFSPGLGCIIAVTAHNCNSRCFVRPAYKRCHFHRKRRVSAPMASCPPAIDPYNRFIIHGPEIQPQPGILRLLIPCKFPLIPQAWVAFRFPDTAFPALVAERHRNFPLIGMAVLPSFPYTDVFIVKCKFPGSIQALPAPPVKVRPWAGHFFSVNHCDSPLSHFRNSSASASGCCRLARRSCFPDLSCDFAGY